MNYKKYTDEFYSLFKSFMDSGFSEDQAFELISNYVRQSVLENLINIDMNASGKQSRADVYKRYYQLTRDKEAKQ